MTLCPPGMSEAIPSRFIWCALGLELHLSVLMGGFCARTLARPKKEALSSIYRERLHQPEPVFLLGQ
jgi:hypothetical protein